MKKRAPTPSTYVIQVLARMQPELKQQERDIVAAGYALGAEPSHVAAMLMVCRRHSIKPTLSLLQRVINNAPQHPPEQTDVETTVKSASPPARRTTSRSKQ